MYHCSVFQSKFGQKDCKLFSQAAHTHERWVTELWVHGSTRTPQPLSGAGCTHTHTHPCVNLSETNGVGREECTALALETSACSRVGERVDRTEDSTLEQHKYKEGKFSFRVYDMYNDVTVNATLIRQIFTRILALNSLVVFCPSHLITQFCSLIGDISSVKSRHPSAPVGVQPV